MPRRLTTAREYLRVSQDRSGQQRSTDQQHADNVAAAKRESWKLRTPYRDEESASRFARNGRNGFDQLLADEGRPLRRRPARALGVVPRQ